MSLMEFSQDVATQAAPEPLPAQDYPAEIVAAEIKTSPTSGNRYLALTFMIDADSYPADFTEGDPDGTKLGYNRVVMEDTPRGRYNLRRLCEAVGAKVPSRTFDPSDLLSLRATVTVSHQLFEGENRAQIAKINSI